MVGGRVVGGCVVGGRMVGGRVVGGCVVGGCVVGGRVVGGRVGRAVGCVGCAVGRLSPSASTPRRSARIISSAFCLSVGTPIVKSKHVRNE